MSYLIVHHDGEQGVLHQGMKDGISCLPDGHSVLSTGADHLADGPLQGWASTLNGKGLDVALAFVGVDVDNKRQGLRDKRIEKGQNESKEAGIHHGQSKGKTKQGKGRKRVDEERG